MRSLQVFIGGLVLAAMSVALPGRAAAFPDKAISMIVPFGAGGGFDGLARALSVRLEKLLNVPIVVKNARGSGGRRGSILLFKSKPDGYTVGFAHFVPFQTDELLLGRKPAIDYRKFAVIYKIAQGRHFIFVRKSLPFKSLADLKSANRTIKFSSTGVGAITWVEANALGSSVGFPVNFVTGYKNLPAAALAVAKGETDAGVGSAHHFRGVVDDVRVLVFLGTKRDAKFPGVPSIAELGYPRLTNLGSPRVVSAPPGTPESRLKVIRAAIRKVVADPGFVTWAKETGYYLDPRGPAGTRKSLEVNAAIYRGLKPLIDKALGK